jgi:hypothetical protein
LWKNPNLENRGYIYITTGSLFFWGGERRDCDYAITIDQSKIVTRSQVQFITLFFWGAQLCCAFHQPRQAARFGAEKPISWAKPSHFDFFTINFTVWSHILSTIRDALCTLWIVSEGLTYSQTYVTSQSSLKSCYRIVCFMLWNYFLKLLYTCIYFCEIIIFNYYFFKLYISKL